MEVVPIGERRDVPIDDWPEEMVGAFVNTTAMAGDREQFEERVEAWFAAMHCKVIDLGGVTRVADGHVRDDLPDEVDELVATLTDSEPCANGAFHLYPGAE